MYRNVLLLIAVCHTTICGQIELQNEGDPLNTTSVELENEVEQKNSTATDIPVVPEIQEQTKVIQPLKRVPHGDVGIEAFCEFPAVENARVNSDEGERQLYSKGDTIEVECLAGFHSNHLRTFHLVCMDDGQWDTEIPVCVAVTCELPADLENGRRFVSGNVLGQVLPFGTRVTYQCDNGYKLQGPKDRWCESTGWSDENPVCHAITCKEFPELQNGQPARTSDIYFPGNEVEIECDFGFKSAVGNKSYLICTSNGTWNKARSLCTIATCPSPPDIPNGWFKQDGHERFEKKIVYDFTDKITFGCDSGFALQGKKSISCRAQGWTEPFPKCTGVKCPRPPVPSEAWIKNDDYKTDYAAGEIVEYECPDWYQLNGDSARTCTERGWTGRPVECKLRGCQLPPPQGSGVIFPQLRNAFEKFAKKYIPFYYSIIAKCPEGYKTNGRQEAVCQTNGKWIVPKCIEISCRKPYQVANGFVEGIYEHTNKYFYNHRIVHRCFPGYDLVGLSERFCRESGWTGSLPKCIEKGCYKPTIPNGIAVQYKYTWPVPSGGVAEVECNQGYKLIGGQTIECTKNQMWNDTLNKCEGIICIRPLFATGHAISAKGSWPLKFNETAYIVCNQGYRLADDNPVIRCNEDERWNNFANACIADQFCRGNFYVNNGKVQPETLKVIGDNPSYEMGKRLPVGFRVKYECNRGYRMNGVADTVCTDQGWSRATPFCEEIICPTPVTPNGRINAFRGYWSYRVNGLVQVQCDSGYTLGDEWPVVQCNEQGQWNDTFYKCSADVSCQLPRGVPNGKAREDIFYQGRLRTRLPVDFHLTYECNPGYKVIGQPEIVCTADGWSAYPPVCQEIICSPPRNPENGMLMENGPFRLNSTAFFKCYYGFHLDPSDDVWTCTEDGWTGPNIQCKATYCPSLDPIKNGQFHTPGGSVIDEGVDKWPMNTVMSYSCDEPYKMNGEPQVQCMPYGQWFPDPPVCEGAYCTKPNIEFSVPTSKQFRFQPGEKFAVQCLRGYKLNDTNELVCLEDGSWWPGSVACEENLCGPPPPLLFGKFSPLKSYYHFGDTVRYVCSDSTVYLDGEREHTCTELGWAQKMPSCVVKRVKTCDCPLHLGLHHTLKLERPAGGPYTVGESVVVECRPGFQPMGNPLDNRIVCTPHGNWSLEKFNCIESKEGLCPPPPAIENGRLMQEKIEHRVGDTITIICNRGYRPVNGSDVVSCHPGGKWEENFAQCEEVWCSAPQLPTNGILENAGTHPNGTWPFHSEAIFICEPGYQLLGHHWIKCLQNGWSANPPICKEIACSDPGTPEEGWKNMESVAVGSRVQFSCFSGYELVGPKERICLKNGQWSDEQPYCHSGKSSCPGLPIPTGGMKSGTYYNENGQVNFACTSGYMFVGTQVRTCKNGTWTGTDALCVGKNEFNIPEAISQELQTSLKKISSTQNFALKKSTQRHKFSEPIIAAPKNVAVYFILDATTSIGRTNFELEKEFVKAIVQKLNISKSAVRVGVITLCSQAVAEFFPSDFHSKHNLLEALDKIVYKEGSASLQAALEILGDMMKATQSALQGVARSHVFLLTDGKITSGLNPVGTANKIKEQYDASFTLLVLTGQWRKQILYNIATDKNHIFFLDSFTTLRWLNDQIIKDTIDYSKCGRGLNQQTQPAYLQHLGLDGKNMTLPWPWMVFVSVRGKSVCRGSVINSEWILTSAWCVTSGNRTFPPEDFSLDIGIFPGSLSAKEVHTHPQYNSATVNNNVALIRLKEPLTFRETIRPVCLPLSLQNRTLYLPGEFGYVSSWGERSSEGKYRLRHIPLPIQSKSACNGTLDENQTTFCAGNGADHLTARNGDHGGPLIQYQLDSDGQTVWVQIGIASLPTHHLYNYFTDVSKVLNWIRAFVPV